MISDWNIKTQVIKVLEENAGEFFYNIGVGKGFQTMIKNQMWGQAQWLSPVIPVTWEVEIGRIVVWGQPEQKISQIPFQ
jgi:hypothetical protein